MVWPVTNERADCRPSVGTNKHAQNRKRRSLLDDNSTATAVRDNYIRQLQNHDYMHMTTTTSYKSSFTARYTIEQIACLGKPSARVNPPPCKQALQYQSKTFNMSNHL